MSMLTKRNENTCILTLVVQLVCNFDMYSDLNLEIVFEMSYRIIGRMISKVAPLPDSDSISSILPPIVSTTCFDR